MPLTAVPLRHGHDNGVWGAPPLDPPSLESFMGNILRGCTYSRETLSIRSDIAYIEWVCGQY